MSRLQNYQGIVNVLVRHSFRVDAESIANEIMKEVFPLEDEIQKENETCGQCGGKKTITIKEDHGNFSMTYWNTVCGRCFGTGKLTTLVQERY